MRRCPSSCIGMSSEDCSECSDSVSDLGIEESTTASLVLVICHPVEVRAGCCLEADASDSPLTCSYSMCFGESSLLDQILSDQLYQLVLLEYDLKSCFSSTLDSILFLLISLVTLLRFLILDDSGPTATEYFSIKSAVCRRDVVIVVDSGVDCGDEWSSDEGLVDEKFVNGEANFPARRLTLLSDDLDQSLSDPVWSSCMGSGSGPARASCAFSGTDTGMLAPDVTVDESTSP
ncbi:hypothetical protein Tco_0878857 [Tanacetum coccineum]|uniref:Uncharacterized protein n=1 Tax=Tanacetum coccineum TaxID=301880 RepID=A0ABQ5BZ32_9ASTR